MKNKYGHGFLGIGIKFLTEFKKYTIPLKQPWFTYVEEGKKTVEGRLNVGIFSKIHKGDIITFVNQNKKINTRVMAIDHYQTFANMLKNKTLKKTLPNISSNTEGVQIYRNIYPENKEKKFGVVAITIQKI